MKVRDKKYYPSNQILTGRGEFIVLATASIKNCILVDSLIVDCLVSFSQLFQIFHDVIGLCVVTTNIAPHTSIGEEIEPEGIKSMSEIKYLIGKNEVGKE